LTVRRDEQEKKLRVELAKFPVRGVKVITSPAPAWRGLRVDYATALAPDNAAFAAPPPDPAGCVVVSEVEKGSPAAAAQLQVGAFISRVGSTPVRTPREFHAAVAGKTGNVPLQLSSAGPVPEIRTVKATAN